MNQMNHLTTLFLKSLITSNLKPITWVEKIIKDQYVVVCVVCYLHITYNDPQDSLI